MGMNNPLALLLAALAGTALGAFYFGGLWWTVRQTLAARQPALWVLGSLMLRMGVTMSGFYWVAGGDWRRMLSCLAGFVMARLIVTRLTRLPQTNQPDQAREARHAPEP
ncbi:MAG: hypothetical protein FD135_3669 [Comamonadaceae bacterium]|nr:MAG: hypothetical protein FD135_3669 [Comamonadaceae bacterium]